MAFTTVGPTSAQVGDKWFPVLGWDNGYPVFSKEVNQQVIGYQFELEIRQLAQAEKEKQDRLDAQEAELAARNASFDDKFNKFFEYYRNLNKGGNLGHPLLAILRK